MSIPETLYTPDTALLNYVIAEKKLLTHICIGGFTAATKNFFTGTLIYGDGDSSTRLSIVNDKDLHYRICILESKQFLSTGNFGASLQIRDNSNNIFVLNNCSFTVLDSKVLPSISKKKPLSVNTFVGIFPEIFSSTSIDKYRSQIDFGHGTKIFRAKVGSETTKLSTFRSGSGSGSGYHCVNEEVIPFCECITGEIRTCLFDENGNSCYCIVDVNGGDKPVPNPNSISFWLVDARPRVLCRKEEFCYEATITGIPMESNGGDESPFVVAPCFGKIIWGDGCESTGHVTPIPGTTSFSIKAKHKYKHCGKFNLTVVFSGISSVAVVEVYDCEKC